MHTSLVGEFFLTPLLICVYAHEDLVLDYYYEKKKIHMNLKRKPHSKLGAASLFTVMGNYFCML